MECGGCGDTKKELFCARCLRQGLKKHTEANQILKTQLKASKSRSERILYGPENVNAPVLDPSRQSLPSPSSKIAQAVRLQAIRTQSSGSIRGLNEHRLLSAQIYQLETQNAAVAKEVQRQGSIHSAKLQNLRGRKEEVARRRATLSACLPPLDKKLDSKSAARTSPEDNPRKQDAYHILRSDLDTIQADSARTARANDQVSLQLVHARRVLVEETIRIFGVQRVSSSSSTKPPSLDSNAKDKAGAAEWEIAGLRLPSPERFTDYSSNHLNAVFEHFIHLLSIITGYLDIVLPFTPQWQGFSTSTGHNGAADEDFTSGSRVDLGPHVNFTSLDTLAADLKESGLHYATTALGAIGRGMSKEKMMPTVYETRSEETKQLVTLDGDTTPLIGKSDDDQRVRPKSSLRVPHVGKISLSASGNIPFIALPDDDVSVQQDSEAASRHLHASLQKRALLYVSSSREKWKRRQRKRATQHLAEEERDLGQDNRGTGGVAALAIRDKHKEKEDHLNLAYTMLMLDVVYMAQTQGVVWVEEILNSQQTSGEHVQERPAVSGLLVNPLRLIDDLRWSEGLGRASHAPSSAGSLTSIVLPVRLADMHTAVVAAFAEDPHGASTARGRTERIRERDQGKAEAQGGGELDVDDWDLV